MLHAVQFTHSESHFYSCTCSQKLEILSTWRVKYSVNMRQHLAFYTSVASKNTGVQRVKTPVKTPLLKIQNKNRKFKTTNSDCNGVWQSESLSRLMENKGSQKVRMVRIPTHANQQTLWSTLITKSSICTFLTLLYGYTVHYSRVSLSPMPIFF